MNHTTLKLQMTRKQLLLCAMMALTVQGLCAFDNRKFFNVKSDNAQKTEVSQWAFLEQTFIIDTHAEKQAIWNHIYTALPAAFALFSGYKYWNLVNAPKDTTPKETKDTQTITKTNPDGTKEIKVTTVPKDTKDKDILKDLLDVKNVYLIGGTIATAMFASKALECYLNYHCNRHVVENFLKNWERNRSLTPHEFHHVFDALVDVMDINGDEAVLAHANEIVDIMQSMVMRHFEKRYEKVLTIQTLNNLGETKAILDVLKTAIDTAKGLA